MSYWWVCICGLLMGLQCHVYNSYERRQYVDAYDGIRTSRLDTGWHIRDQL